MPSNPPLLDDYLEEHYFSVPGMSSKFSALISAEVMRLQSGKGWHGNVAEIGAFEGRFLMALALALQAGERALAVDVFDWPDHQVRSRLIHHLDTFGLTDRVDVICGDSRCMTPDRITTGRNRLKIRFFHIDGDHQERSLTSDMELALQCMEPWGVICIDDMLSPAYPELGLAVAKVLKSNSDWLVFCVIDREDIAAASKFLLCRAEYAQFYIRYLAIAFERNIWRLWAQFPTHKALVLSPEPRLATFRPGGGVVIVQ